MAPQPINQNTLFYGDNLPVLREHIPDSSIDLIYLDPPFNSNRNYNVLFKDEKGKESEAQITAFEDTWHWNEAAERTFNDLFTHPNVPANVAEMIGALRHFIGSNQMMAYLVMMAARLVELHRVLKPTGSLYLHCDPTASHYLKIVLDTIFDPRNFRSEIIWQRTLAKALMSRQLPNNHDVILSYQRSVLATWNSQATFQAYDAVSLDPKTASKYTHRDADGRLYQLDNLINPNPDRPNLTYEFLGVTKVWRWTRERMQAAYEAGLVIQPRPGAVPRYKRFLDEQRGKPLGDVWTDIPPLNSQAKERLGYPTQKPLALLERIIQASSNPGDVLLDPFCGCGTAIAAAQKLGRRWVGIDITHLSIALMKYRLKDMFGEAPQYQVIGEPKDVGAARQLAIDSRDQFQWWAVSLLKAKPLGGEAGSKVGKKGADRGIDGVINFIEEETGRPERVLVQVKSGHVQSGDVRDLRGTMERERAPIGVFITLEPPTSEMRREAVSAGFYTSRGWNEEYPRIQLLTVDELLSGQRVRMPPQHGTFRQAPRATTIEAEQARLQL